MFKDTALVSTIAVADLMFVANTISAQSYRALEVFTVAAAIYFVVAFPASLITNHLERRMQQSGQRVPGRRKPIRALVAASKGEVN